MRTSLSITFMLAIACLLLSSSGCSRPLLYRPSCDLHPVLAVPYPDHIDTLSRCPRDETHAEGGINKHSGGRQPDDIKEMFNLTKGGAEYRFNLFFSDSGAAQWYESEKRFMAEHHPVFREVTTNGCTACLYYTEQPRADPEGGWAPMGYYVSRVCFRVRNAVVEIEVRQNKPRTDDLSLAVQDLAQMLSAALVSTNQTVK